MTVPENPQSLKTNFWDNNFLFKEQ